MKTVFSGKSVFIIEGSEMRVRSDVFVYNAADGRVVVEPFAACVVEVAMFRIVTVVCSEGLRAMRIVEASLDYSGCGGVAVVLGAPDYRFLSVINESIGG